jgi:predicted acylesterase/phospholipase RssA
MRMTISRWHRAIRHLPALGLLAIGLALGGCGAVVTRAAAPADLTEAALPLGLPGLRNWGDIADPAELDAIMQRQAPLLRARFGADLAAGRTPRLHYLALSGGGPDGAFGAGVLKAWSGSGSRPEFAAVSGVSTGAIIAPFAFLGSDYDPVLEDIYTTLSTDQVMRRTIISGILEGVALTDTTGLANKIAQYVTPDFLARVAAAYADGRNLFIGTTNLDHGRPVIWNMGAIAASGHPGALQLFRDVIRASAAIPIAFPPMFIPVQTADGRVFDEMHVDGGASSQVMLISPQVPIAALTRQALGRNLDRVLWVIMNNRVLAEHAPVRPRIQAIGGAAVSSLIRGSGVGDIYKLYLIAQRDEIGFRATWIPPRTPCVSNEAFDPVYMRCLFDFAGAEFRRGELWSTLPPYFVQPPETGPTPTGRTLARPGRP